MNSNTSQEFSCERRKNHREKKRNKETRKKRKKEGNKERKQERKKKSKCEKIKPNIHVTYVRVTKNTTKLAFDPGLLNLLYVAK